MGSTKRKTTTEFIEEARKVHGDKYDYSKVEYKNNKTKVCIICPEHGEFWQIPLNHIRQKQGCPTCGLHNFVDTDIFINKVRSVHGDKYDYSKTTYVNYETKVILTCPIHGDFTQKPSSLLKGYGCPKCKREENSKQYYEWRTCPICGKQFYIRKKYEKITCSEECYKKYIQIHKTEINQKRSHSLKSSFSKMTIEQKLEIQKNREKTFLEKYGTIKPNQSKEYREKMSKLFKSIDWSQRSEKIKNEQLIPKYTKICEDDNLTLLEFRNRYDCTVKCNKCGTVFTTYCLGNLTEQTTHNICRVCHPIDNVIYESVISTQIEEILKEQNIFYHKNTRSVIKPLELDFYLPEHKLAFEINGNYWHSELKKNKNYHLHKTKLCDEQGIKLIHIFEDEVRLKYDIVKSRILNLIGKTPNTVYARQCKIRELSYIEKKNFFNINHIDEDSVSKYNIGLFLHNELVCAASFGERKISKKQQFELIRFANKINHNVVGGFSKIMKYFMKQYKPSELITYADIRWSGINPQNTVYSKNGFEYIDTSSPNYFYLASNDFVHRLNRCKFMKHKLVKEGADPNKTEKEIMKERGYTRIWDCGTLKFKYKKEE